MASSRLFARAVGAALFMGSVVACSSSSSETASPDAADSATDGSVAEAGVDASMDTASPPAPSGAATVSGPFGGKTLAVKDVFAFQDPTTVDAGTRQDLTVKITDYLGACGLAMANDSHKANASYLKLEVKQLSASPIGPGTYPIESSTDAGTNGYAEASFKIYDAACAVTSTKASAGSITIGAASASEVTGTFQLTIGADVVSGSFTAPVCAGASGSGTACVP